MACLNRSGSAPTMAEPEIDVKARASIGVRHPEEPRSAFRWSPPSSSRQKAPLRHGVALDRAAGELPLAAIGGPAGFTFSAPRSLIGEERGE
jgi:hypothetical protein